MGILILVIAAALVVYVISIYNTLKRLNIRIDEAFATMDVYLKKRYDLIPNLVNTAKGYMKHEKETLEAVISARNSSISSRDKNDKSENESNLEGALSRLFALAESYPDLKADSQFISLNDNLTSIEEQIAKARVYYNAVVRDYNTKLEVFPSSIIASMMNLTPVKYFEVTNTAERENVQVNF